MLQGGSYLWVKRKSGGREGFISLWTKFSPWCQGRQTLQCLIVQYNPSVMLAYYQDTEDMGAKPHPAQPVSGDFVLGSGYERLLYPCKVWTVMYAGRWSMHTDRVWYKRPELKLWLKRATLYQQVDYEWLGSPPPPTHPCAVLTHQSGATAIDWSVNRPGHIALFRKLVSISRLLSAQSQVSDQ